MRFQGNLVVGIALASLLSGVATAQDHSQRAPAEGSKYDNLIKVRTHGGVVVSESMQASQAGIEALDAGGNAVDAAIATTFAIGVTRPEMCGIGGGGFLLYRGADGTSAALDFREKAPAAMEQNTFNEGSSGGPTYSMKKGIHNEGSGHTVVGVPGVVAGMDEALNELGSGKLSLAKLIAPAERYAREGITVSINLQTWFLLDQALGARLANYPETTRIYGGRFVHGPSPYEITNDELEARLGSDPALKDPTAPGEPAAVAAFKQEDYAKSLRLIMDHGSDAFYAVRTYDGGASEPQPSIGKLIVEDMANAEWKAKVNPVLLAKTIGTPNDIGLIDSDDLESYKPVWRTPLQGRYRGHEVITMPPPGGGMVVLEILNLLENFDLASFGHSSADHIHSLAEAEKLAWADRIAYLADPDVESVPTDFLTSKRYSERRAKEIDMNRAKTVAEYGPGTLTETPARKGVHTTHLSVIDREGNAASVTCSLNAVFGSGVVAPGTGFLLNNHMADFDWTWASDRPEPVNAPEGGKRPRSSISPTIVVKGRHPLLVTGGAGGATTIGGVVQQVLNIVDFDLDIFRAIDAARVDSAAGIKCGPELLMLEHKRIDDSVETELGTPYPQGRGHLLCRRGEKGETLDYDSLPLIASAGTDLLTGERLGVSDPRALARDNYDQGPLGQDS